MKTILRISQVMQLTGLAKSTLYKYIKNNEFPVPIQLGVRTVGWLEGDIFEWIQKRINKSPKYQAYQDQKDQTYQPNNEV